MTKYGFSTDVREIEQLLGLEPGDLARQNIDMDLADDCRTLAGRGVDMHDETAVRQSFAATHTSSLGNRKLPRYVDALVLVARDFATMSKGDRLLLPWSRDNMTLEQFTAWVAGRKAAGNEIDVELCEIGCWPVENGDVYGVNLHHQAVPDPEIDHDYYDRNNFVRSYVSDGWISETDLPMEKYDVLSERISRITERRRREHSTKPYTPSDV